MNSLHRAVKQKRLEVSRKRIDTPIIDLVRYLDTFTVRDLRSAIRGGCRIIAEIEKGSPGDRECRSDSRLVGLAQTYVRSGASALSVVTDDMNSGSSLAEVKAIREHIDVPLLVKDIIVDPYQIYEAKAFGADAVFLFTAIVTPSVLRSFLGLIHTLGMTAVVGVHDEMEIRIALDGGARVIGIDNRDVDSIETYLNVTRKLVIHVPDCVTIVSDNRDCSRAVIEELSALGVDAFTVGSALLGSAHPDETLRRLLGHPPTTTDLHRMYPDPGLQKTRWVRWKRPPDSGS
ncbi:MAG: indole-3-glycerol-phosphate synthase [Candidatus Latescibacterota bacterium]|nr:MAG: indole-3-glycerol-phosphate synthase [Candidatus Latescibacterota bacterium]